MQFIGRNFNSDSDVTLRWNSRTGAVLWQGRPSQRGTISGSFRVPRTRSGNYVVLGTQQRADGNPAPGTPSRAALRVRARSARGAVAPPWVSAKPAEPGGPGGVLAELRSATPAPVTLGALLAALALAGSGLMVLSGSARRQLGLAGARRLN